MVSTAERKRRRKARTFARAAAARETEPAPAAVVNVATKASTAAEDRDGLAWLLDKRRLTARQAQTGRWYGMLWRTAQIGEAPVKVADWAGAGGGGGTAGGMMAPPSGMWSADWIADCRRRLADARAALSDHEATIAVLDLICGARMRPREISTDQRETEQIETVLRVGLDMLEHHVARVVSKLVIDLLEVVDV